MTVTGNETPAQDLNAILRETQTKLDAAQAEAASLRVLLAIRTHQVDLAWQARQRGAADLEEARAREIAGAAECAAQAEAVGADAVARAEARTEAVRSVLGAVLASLRFWALDRRRFRTLIAQAGRAAPNEGPGAERHAILLTEARRVLGRTE